MVKQYLDLSKQILERGEYEWNDRTQTGTISLFGEVSHYDLREGFPITTTKKLPWRIPMDEMLYFFRGDSDLGILLDKKINIWNANGFDFYLRRNNLTEKFPKHSSEWREKFKWYIHSVKNNPCFREKQATLGRIYGVQARDWRGPDGESIDQLTNFLNKLKKDSSSRSNIVSHFNPAEMNKMALGPCHLLYQSRVIVDDNNRLDIAMYQRSCDNLLGVPFNAIQYAFLIEMAAKEIGLTPGKFAHIFANLHYYIGISPRSDFLRNKDNLKEFQGMMKEVSKPEDYLELKDWYLANAPLELKGTEGTDQIPFALVQFSREPRKIPTLEFKIKEDFDFFEAIKMNAKDLVGIKGYNPYPSLNYTFNEKLIEPLIAA